MLHGSISHINNQQDLDSYEDDVRFNATLVALGYDFLLTEQSQTQVSWTHSHIDRHYTHSVWGNSFYTGNINNVDINTQASLNEHTKIFWGLQFSDEYGENSYLSKKNQQSSGAYTQLHWDNPVVSTQLGYRLSHHSYKHHLSETYNASLFKMIPKVNVLIKASIKSAYRVPTIQEQNDVATGVDLKPETSFSEELTVSKQIHNVLYEVSYFDSDLKNKIDYDSSYKTSNIFKSKQQGFEYRIKATPWGENFLFLM